MAATSGVGVKRIAVIVAALAAGAGLIDCASADEEKITLPVGAHEFIVEIAVTEEERARGLMYRESLPPDHGMLFVFPDSSPRSFWMKNTAIPLSIAYINANGVILEIYDMEPHSLETVRSRYSAKYALEVNRGRFKEVGVSVGDRIDVDSIPR